ncbi:MAG TPA: Hsp20/alpha crystallin family protein [Nitrospiria bacterium]|nr:Hsp20/alpha crystallin family protein [Nitrospiria bacterium]
MPLTKWSPLKEINTLQERMSKLLEDPLFKFPFDFAKPVEGVDWVPAVDIFEKDDAFILKAELPGMEMKDIDITVEGGTLQVKGHRQLEHEEKREDYHRVERVYGQFNRYFSLPDSVNAEKIEAAYDKGVLTVTMGKKEEVKPKKIKVDIKA